MQQIFLPQVFYDINWTLNFFLNTRKESTGNTGNTGTWNTLVLEIHNFFKYSKYSLLEIPVLEIPNKNLCTWSTAQLWFGYLAWKVRHI